MKIKNFIKNNVDKYNKYAKYFDDVDRLVMKRLKKEGVNIDKVNRCVIKNIIKDECEKLDTEWLKDISREDDKISCATYSFFINRFKIVTDGKNVDLLYTDENGKYKTKIDRDYYDEETLEPVSIFVNKGKNGIIKLDRLQLHSGFRMNLKNEFEEFDGISIGIKWVDCSIPKKQPCGEYGISIICEADDNVDDVKLLYYNKDLAEFREYGYEYPEDDEEDEYEEIEMYYGFTKASRYFDVRKLVK